MGSNVAPTYANLYMAFLEDTLVYNNHLFKSHSLLYLRYIDDFLLIWEGSRNSLDLFHQFLNHLENTLKCTVVSDKLSLSFLDVLITMEGDKLKTSLYRKSTDKNNFLHFASFHPEPLKCSLPVSQFVRVKRITSDPLECDEQLRDMSNRFTKRGYSKKVLSTSLDKVQQRSREALIKGEAREKQKDNRLAFVSNFNKAIKQFGRIIRKHLHILQSCLPDVSSFQSPPMLAYKRAKNLKDRLIRADVGSSKLQNTRLLQKPRFGTFLCLTCTQCNSVIKGDTFFHPHLGKKYAIRKYYTCESIFVIYLLKCPCGLLYVGETTQKIKDRISKHKSTIHKGLTTLPVPAHFQQAKHSKSQLKFQIIDSAEPPRRGGDRLMLLHKLEMQWIHRLDIVWPIGLNRDYTPALFIHQ
ncbi:hypothetical protein XELAEV_18003760mg [Xenopus laevis]|nr:hypothetical protein XELAEV_18003760mg [Xenopus laevis]